MIKHDNEPLNEEPSIEDFTVAHYRELIQLAKQSYAFSSYAEIPLGKRFILWRHDCDISVNRALKLAEIEWEEGVSSTYFINPHCEFYNLLEKKQAKLVGQILGLGHALGLHFDANYHETSSEAELEEQIALEAYMLERYFGEKPVAFSFHNPTALHLTFEKNLYGGLVNCYSKKFKKEIPYCSDSNGYWRYRRLRDVLQKATDSCLQVLTHPGWWQERSMYPMERIDRSISGRAEAIRFNYLDELNQTDRKDIDGRQ